MEKLKHRFAENPSNTPLDAALDNYATDGYLLRYIAFNSGAIEPEHAVQEAIVNVYTVADTLDSRDIPAYLRRAVRNEAIDQRRMENRRPTTTIEVALNRSTTQDSVEHTVFEEERETLARELVAALPPDFKQIVEFIYLQELGYQETADIIGIPLGTVKSRISRAMSMLRTRVTNSELTKEDVFF